VPKRVPPLSAKTLERWRPDPHRVLEKVDGAVPGLRVRLSPQGERIWSLSGYVHGERRRIALGANLKLAEARQKAAETRAAISRGEDPSAALKHARARRRAAALGIGTLGSVITAYFEHGPGAALRTGAAQRVMIERVLKDHLKRPALDVRFAELQLTLDAYRSRSSAQHAAVYMRPIIRWASRRELMVKGDPLEAPRGTREREQHVLTQGEVARFLQSLTMSPHDDAARFMLMTAARREEVVGMTWGEIKDGAWVIPAGRRKDTRGPRTRRADDHVVPLSQQALAILDRRGVRTDPEACVFAGGRGARLGNWVRWSAGMKKRLGFVVTPHALRRTCATLAGDLGQPPHVVSALLGHRSIGGALHAGYNQSRYRAEVATALQMVADLMDALETSEDNVIALCQERRRG
jgi:integrase